MSFRIIGDSCTDLTKEMRGKPYYTLVPLTLQIGDYCVVDDDTFDQADFIRRAAESRECPKSACPSPEAFKSALECEEDDVFIITLSSHLSGSYNSARIGIEMYCEEHGEDSKNILLIDSESAAAGQVSIAGVIPELYAEGLSFKEVSERILKLRDEQLTYFVIDSLEPLHKNGRLSGIKTLIATVLNIKPVMAGDHGVIVKLDQARGLRKAYERMAQIAAAARPDFSKSVLNISQCNCPDRAELVKDIFLKYGTFRKIVITEAHGVSTLYAGDGGIVLSII